VTTRSAALVVLVLALAVGAVALHRRQAAAQRAVVAADARARGLVGQVLAEAHQGHVPEATALLKELEQLSPTQPRLPELRGELELAQGHLGPALADFQQAVSAHPELGGAWAEIGFIQILQQHPQEGEVSLQRALALDPHSIPARQHLAERAMARRDRATADVMLQGLVDDTTGSVREGYRRQKETFDARP